MMSTPARVALAALLVLTGTAAAATLTASTAPRTVVQADEPKCTPPECFVIPPRDPETEQRVRDLTDVYDRAFQSLKTTTEESAR